MARQEDILHRFRRWVVWALACGAMLYVAGSVWAGFGRMRSELAGFRWSFVVPVLLLTLANYGLRFLKWHLLLGLVRVRIRWRDSLLIFVTGLSMVISPAKAGELLKPYLVSRRTATPVSTTLPVLVAERLTDGIAMLALAAISIGTYAADKVAWVAVPAGVVVLGLLVLASERLSGAAVALAARVPLLNRVSHRIDEMLATTRRCLSPGPLLWTVALSGLAWWAECVGFHLVLLGFGAKSSLDAATFLYAFATVAGGAMPGGLGIADGALATGAVTLLGAEPAQGVAAALLIRSATLWFGVLLGALALLRFEDLLHQPMEAGERPEAPASPPRTRGRTRGSPPSSR